MALFAHGRRITQLGWTDDCWRAKFQGFVFFLLTREAGHFRRIDTGDPGPFAVGEGVRTVPAPSQACRLLHSDREGNNFMNATVKWSFEVSNL